MAAKHPLADWPRDVVTIVTGYRDPTDTEHRRTRSWAPVPLHGRLGVYVAPDGSLFPRAKVDAVWKARPRGRDAEVVIGFDTSGSRPALVIAWSAPLRRGRVRLYALDRGPS